MIEGGRKNVISHENLFFIIEHKSITCQQQGSK